MAIPMLHIKIESKCILLVHCLKGLKLYWTFSFFRHHTTNVETVSFIWYFADLNWIHLLLTELEKCQKKDWISNVLFRFHALLLECVHYQKFKKDISYDTSIIWILRITNAGLLYNQCKCNLLLKFLSNVEWISALLHFFITKHIIWHKKNFSIKLFAHFQ